MKLSEAIRLGSMLKPQCFHGLWDGVGSCALGAAYDAANLTAANINETHVESVFPFLRHGIMSGLRYRCPLCTEQGNPMGMIAHLNDDHQWTRERIADWVESVERESASAESGAAVLVEIGTQ